MLNINLKVSDNMVFSDTDISAGFEGDHRFTIFTIDAPAFLKGYSCRAEFKSAGAKFPTILLVENNRFALTLEQTLEGKLSMQLVYSDPNGKVVAKTNVLDLTIGKSINATKHNPNQYSDPIAQFQAKAIGRVISTERGAAFYNLNGELVAELEFGQGNSIDLPVALKDGGTGADNRAQAARNILYMPIDDLIDAFNAIPNDERVDAFNSPMFWNDFGSVCVSGFSFDIVPVSFEQAPADPLLPGLFISNVSCWPALYPGSPGGLEYSGVQMFLGGSYSSWERVLYRTCGGSTLIDNMGFSKWRVLDGEFDMRAYDFWLSVPEISAGLSVLTPPVYFWAVTEGPPRWNSSIVVGLRDLLTGNPYTISVEEFSGSAFCLRFTNVTNTNTPERTIQLSAIVGCRK